MTAAEKLTKSIVVPATVSNRVGDAIPVQAMLAGGIDTMEVTFRTACVPDAIKSVAAARKRRVERGPLLM